MLAYDFIVRAFEASGIVAVVAATVGYFIVLRGQTFAGHALSHVGFAGATGAALVGATPLAGLLVFTVGAGVAIGALGDRISGRDVAIGVVLTVSLGFGLLFLSVATVGTTQATALLFGNVLGVTPDLLVSLVLLAAVTLAALGVISRPLLFASLQPELAEARGVPLTLLGIAFLALVALAVAQAAQVVGVLLVFTLMVGPPAAAQLWTTRLWPGIALAAALAVGAAWLGIVLAWYTDWPTTFWIAVLSAIAYLAAYATPARRLTKGPAGRTPPTMRLFSFPTSSASYRTRIALNLKGVSYETVTVNLLAGEHRGPAYRELNPQGRVPSLETGAGDVIVQSLAIMDYLEHAFPQPPIFPADPLARARALGAALVVIADIHPLNNTMVVNYLRDELGQDQAARDKWYAHWVRSGLGALEEMIGDGPFCFGNSPTVADICLVPQVFNARRFNVDISGLRKVLAADEAARALPAFQAAAPERQPAPM